MIQQNEKSTKNVNWLSLNEHLFEWVRYKKAKIEVRKYNFHTNEIKMRA